MYRIYYRLHRYFLTPDFWFAMLSVTMTAWNIPMGLEEVRPGHVLESLESCSKTHPTHYAASR